MGKIQTSEMHNLQKERKRIQKTASLLDSCPVPAIGKPQKWKLQILHKERGAPGYVPQLTNRRSKKEVTRTVVQNGWIQTASCGILQKEGTILSRWVTMQILQEATQTIQSGRKQITARGITCGHRPEIMRHREPPVKPD